MAKRLDTRNNWMTFQFVTKCRYKCFRRQSVIDSCVAGIKELERFGFEFGEMGFPLNHAHISVNVPKKYSVSVAITMMKSWSSRRIFAEHPGFRKRYPRGSFWSQYEHHQSTGHKDKEAADKYIRNQLRHHGVKIIDDRQQRLNAFAAERGYVNA